MYVQILSHDISHSIWCELIPLTVYYRYSQLQRQRFSIKVIQLCIIVFLQSSILFANERNNPAYMFNRLSQYITLFLLLFKPTVCKSFYSFNKNCPKI
jgi:hypothetical protein